MMVVVLSVVAMATHFLPPTDDKTPHHSSTGCGRPRPPSNGPDFSVETIQPHDPFGSCG